MQVFLKQNDWSFFVDIAWFKKEPLVSIHAQQNAWIKTKIIDVKYIICLIRRDSNCPKGNSSKALRGSRTKKVPMRSKSPA